jgi:hypothetical protein
MENAMPRRLQIIVLAFLLLSLVANAGLLWLYAQTQPKLLQMRQDLDRQAQELEAIPTLREERTQLENRAQELEAEKQQLEEEVSRLRGQLEPLQNNADLLEQLDQLEAATRAVRRRIPPEPVERTLVTREELRTYLEAQFARDYSQDQAAAESELLTLLGLLPKGTDLYSLLLDLYTEQVSGFYDLEEGKMYLVSGGELGPLEKITFVHEYVHAIQDQVFDLGSQVEAVEEDSDRSVALTALAEGDASLAMAQFVADYPDVVSASDLLNQGLGIDSPKLDAAPPIVQRMLLFPYEAGLRFAMQEYLKIGWAGVDALWADPPQSTEQLLHPERYPDDVPVLVTLPRLEGTLGPGWRLADEDTLGEFLLRQHLALFLDEEAVDDAATGWGGDHYLLYTHAERQVQCLVLRILWDDRDEADEFVSLYEEFADARYGAAGDGNAQDGMWWDGSPGLYLEQTREEVWLIWAPNRETADSVARELR